MKKNIFITQKIPVIAENILKEAGFAVRVNKSGQRLTQPELIKHLKHTDAVIS
ncbi:MAG: D-glycerate dehydrogenase, partial [Ignavibacteriales bacterium]|nr:D-glycerate dehydrogenase [Ignavibacteriales bacterium]